LSAGWVAAPRPEAGVGHLPVVLPLLHSEPAGRLVRSSIISGVHQLGYQTAVPQSSPSLWLVYIKSSLMSTPLRQVCKTTAGKGQMKEIRTEVHVQPLYSPK